LHKAAVRTAGTLPPSTADMVLCQVYLSSELHIF